MRAVQAITKGASDFIEKPFDDQILTDAFHTVPAQVSRIVRPGVSAHH